MKFPFQGAIIHPFVYYYNIPVNKPATPFVQKYISYYLFIFVIAKYFQIKYITEVQSTFASK